MSNFPFLSHDRILDIHVWFDYDYDHALTNDKFAKFDTDNVYKYLDGTHVIEYKIDSALSSDGLCIGDVVSASFSMTIPKWSEYIKRFSSDSYNSYLKRYTYDQIKVGAVVTAAIAVKEMQSDGTYTTLQVRPFGVWEIESVESDEYDLTITVKGHDMLTYLENARVSERGTYISDTTWGYTFKRMLCNCIQNARPRMAGDDDFVGRRSVIPTDSSIDLTSKPWWVRPQAGQESYDPSEGVAIKSVLKDIATVAGGFAFVDLKGAVQIHSFDSKNTYPLIITEPYVFSLANYGDTFRFVQLVHPKIRNIGYDDDNKIFIDDSLKGKLLTNTQYSLSDTYKYGIKLEDTIVVKGDMPTATDMVNAFDSIGTLSSGSIKFVGDPIIQVGDIVLVMKSYIEDSPEHTEFDASDTGSFKFLSSSISYVYDGSLSCTISSELPTASVSGTFWDRSVTTVKSGFEELETSPERWQ